MAEGESPQVVTMAIIKCNLYAGMNYLFNLKIQPTHVCLYYRIAGKLGEWTLFEHLAKESLAN